MAITRPEFLKKMREYRISQYRPAMFREVFGTIMYETLDDIVDKIEMFEVTPYGQIKILASNTPSGLPITTFDGTPSTAKVITGGLAFAFTNEFLMKCDANRVNWREVAGKANFNIVEQFLDRTAFLGNTQYGLGGLAANGSVALYTLGNKTGGGIAWSASATHEECVQDLLGIAAALENGANQYFKCDTILLPSAAYDAGVNKVNQYTQMNVLRSAMDRNPTIKRILKIAHLTGAGAGATNRAVGMCTSGEVAMVGERPFRDHPIYDLPMGGLVPESFRTSGCIVESPQGLTYADGL